MGNSDPNWVFYGPQMSDPAEVTGITSTTGAATARIIGAVVGTVLSGSIVGSVVGGIIGGLADE